jgi:hypothetical protein
MSGWINQVKINFEFTFESLLAAGGSEVNREVKTVIVDSKSGSITSCNFVNFVIELSSLRSVNYSSFTDGIRVISVDVLCEESIHIVLKDIETNLSAEARVILDHKV